MISYQRPDPSYYKLKASTAFEDTIGPGTLVEGFSYVKSRAAFHAMTFLVAL